VAISFGSELKIAVSAFNFSQRTAVNETALRLHHELADNLA
jgi:hypothetical protein